MNKNSDLDSTYLSQEKKNDDIQTQTNEPAEDPFGNMLPTTEKLFGWAILSLKFCLVIFATLALVLDRKFAIHMVILFVLALGLFISLHIVWKPLFSNETPEGGETEAKIEVETTKKE